jgi:catechol 2,3-dioxygenase
VPAFPVDEGSQIGFYYNDPDGNSIEINVSNYGEHGPRSKHMQTSPDFARRPLGVDLDPEKMVAAREAGATPWERHKRAWQGEFAPAKPFDPTTML